MTRQVTIELPEEAAQAINIRPEQLPRELREAAVLLWFEEGRLSQGQAAAALELQRGEFFDVLMAHQISPVQMTPQQLEDEFRRT